MTKREFQVENEYHYNRKGPLLWVFSHLMRYPLLPLALIAGAVANNLAYSYIQVFVGRAFDVIRVPEFQLSALFIPVIAILASAAGQGITGVLRNFAVEVLAQKVGPICTVVRERHWQFEGTSTPVLRVDDCHSAT